MLPTLCLLALLLSLPRQGDGTLQHDEDDQGLLEARLFQVTAGGDIRGGKKENTSLLSLIYPPTPTHSFLQLLKRCFLL